MNELLVLILAHRHEADYANLLRALRLEIDRELAAIYAALPYSTHDCGDRRGSEMPRTKASYGPCQ